MLQKTIARQLTFLPISPLGVMEIARKCLQGNHSGQRVIADEKGMPIVPVGPNGGPRRMKDLVRLLG